MRLRRTLLAVLVWALLACQLVGPSPTSSPSEPSDIGSSLVFSPSVLPDTQAGRPYLAAITVSGNDTPVFSIAVDSGELPSGLTLTYQENDSMAKIEGTPEEPGEFEFTIHAYCYGTNVSGQTGEQPYQLSVK